MKYLDVEFKLSEKISTQAFVERLNQIHQVISWTFLDRETKILGYVVEDVWCYEYTFNIQNNDELRIVISKYNDSDVNQTARLDYINILFEEGYICPLDSPELFELILQYGEVIAKKEDLQEMFERNKNIKEQLQIPILFKPNFEEFYEGEINDVLLSILKRAHVNGYERNILDEILSYNHEQGIRDEHLENIHHLILEPLNKKSINELKKEGIYIYGGHHIFCRFYEDPKYQLVIASSSDPSLHHNLYRLIKEHYF